MPPGIGFSFQPGSQDTQLPPHGQGGQGSAPQQAIRTLSLRVPQTQSVPGIAPLPLLNAKGGGGSDLNMLLLALLRAFGGGGGMSPHGRGGGGGQAPPRIRPIDPPQDFPGRGGAEPVPPFDISRVPGGGIGNTGRPRGPLEPAPSEWPDGGWWPQPSSPEIPNDFPVPGNPTPEPLDFNERVPGGGLMGGVLRGRKPQDVFPGGVQPLF